MSERKYKWENLSSRNFQHWRLYAQTHAGKGGVESVDPAWYVSVKKDGDDPEVTVEFWLLAPEALGTMDLMNGDWADLCACATIEEAKAAGENALRLNLGNWP